jgi:hypothetical protein
MQPSAFTPHKNHLGGPQVNKRSHARLVKSLSNLGSMKIEWLQSIRRTHYRSSRDNGTESKVGTWSKTLPDTEFPRLILEAMPVPVQKRKFTQEEIEKAMKAQAEIVRERNTRYRLRRNLMNASRKDFVKENKNKWQPTQ